MKPLAFLRSEQASRLIQQAGAAVALPISAHYVDAASTAPFDGPALAGCGANAVCTFVCSTSAGRRACRDSRVDGGALALRRGRATAFLCHMGFACAAAPVLEHDRQSGFVLTVGPYCPAGAAPSLEPDARAGLTALDIEAPDQLADWVASIHVIDADAPPLFSDWLSRLLSERWQTMAASTDSEANVDEEAVDASKRRKRRSQPNLDPFLGRGIATALVSGQSGQALALIRTALEDAGGHESTLEERRFVALGVAAAALAALTRAGRDTAAEQDLLTELSRRVFTLEAHQLAPAVYRALRAKTRPAETRWTELNEIVVARMAEGVSVAEAGALLGLHPTAVTQRLKRTFNMTYSEYLGRLRVDRAKELLRRTKLSVAEVGRRVGVPDASNLNKLFRRFEHTTPQQYRERVKTN